MTEAVTTTPTPQPDDELLVAYLDGELDAAASSEVERRLADEPLLRTRLQSLVGTWDLLDELPRATVDDAFAHTTVAMVAVEAERRLDAQSTLGGAGVRLLGAAVLIAAVTFGFRSVRTIWPSPDEQLLRDLPVIERFDLYRQVDDVEFVRLLDEKGLFTVEEPSSGRDTGGEVEVNGDESPATEVQHEP